MPEPKAFLAIERTMAAAMRSQWDKRARELADKLQPLVDAKKWGEAQTVVNQITLDGVENWEFLAPQTEEEAGEGQDTVSLEIAEAALLSAGWVRFDR